MSRAGVKEKEVFEIANRLRASDQPITVRAIREELQRGSLSTINQHLAKWHRLNFMIMTQDDPNKIPEAVQLEVEKAWRSVRESVELYSSAISRAPQNPRLVGSNCANGRIAVSFLARKVVSLSKKNSELQQLLKFERLGALVRSTMDK